MIDRTELRDRRLDDLRRGPRLTNITVNERKARRRCKIRIRDLARSCHHVITTLQECLDNSRSNPLRGACDNSCLLACHTYLPLLIERVPTYCVYDRLAVLPITLCLT